MLTKNYTQTVYSVYVEYSPRLLSFTEKFVSPHVAEDLVHDIFLRFWDKGVFYLPEEDIRKLLFTSARNACIDYLRKQHTEQDALSNQALQLKLNELDYHQSSEEKFMKDDLLAKLMAEVEDLPEKTRLVFKMYYQEGLRASEIAERTGVSQRTVENQLYRSLNHLRQKCKHLLFTYLLL